MRVSGKRAVAVIAVVVGLGLVSSASGAPGDLTLVSTNGVKGDGASDFPAISDDGTAVAFASMSTNLAAGDSDTTADIYVKDLGSGDLLLASTSDADVKANDDCHDPNLSANGAKVAFWSSATNLDPADTDAAPDVYVKNLVTGDITLASTDDGGAKAAGSLFPTLSADGNLVSFSTDSQLDSADSDSLSDIYVKNLTTGDTTLVSITGTGTKSNGDSFNGNLSGDGTRVAFQSTATNLDAADADTAFDIYVKDLTSGDLVLASTKASGTKGNDVSQLPTLNGDGTRVAFRSTSTNLDSRDTDNLSDVYVKNLATGSLRLVSTDDSGQVKGNGDSLSPTISGDGNRVAFRSLSTNLDPGDSDAISDVYVKDISSGNLAVASTSSRGTKADHNSFWPSLSLHGTLLAFYSAATNLDAADTDTTTDVYLKQLPSASRTADIAVSITDRRDPVRHGRSIVYTVTVQNLGAARATGVVLSDQIPAGITFGSATGQAACTQSGGIVTCSLGAIPAGSQKTVNITGVAPSSPGTVTDHASASANEADPVLANNTAAETTTVT
jgi:uncharacterized repeat protein (TIGR01451 family)